MSTVLATISGSSEHPKNIGEGLYLSGHWSFQHETDAVIGEYPDWDAEEGGPPSAYGVCDSPDDFMTRFGASLKADPRAFVVSFVEISKSRQSPTGGWRWHKWGPYVGKQTKTCEYLYDEPVVERVFTYHVYEVRRS